VKKRRSGSSKVKKKNPVRKLVPKMLLDMDPPMIARDPKPRASLMELMGKGLRGPVWKERFVVCARGRVAWYPPNCAIDGFVESDALGSIPVPNIHEAVVDADGYLLDLITERQAYHFRSKQHNEVAKWQDAVTNCSPPGAMVNLLKLPKIGKGVYKDNFWEAVGAKEETVKQGGIPFGVRMELVTKEQDRLVHDIFDQICAQDVTDVNKKHIEDNDLAKWVVNRAAGNADLAKQIPSMQECTDAVSQAIGLAPDMEGTDCKFEAFKAAICASRSPNNPTGSELARIVELAMQGKSKVEDSPDEVGEMSIGQKLYEYHKFLGNVLKSCRDGESDEKGNDKVTLTKVVAESYCNNVVKEVEALLKRHKAYKARLHGLDPSLRSRCQHRAIDDVFDGEMLPGTRWVQPV